MRYPINNQQKLNDIVFANRNKSYGAYVIRSSYGNTVLKSLSFMSLGIGTMMVIIYLLSREDAIRNDLTVGQVIEPDSIFVVPFKKIPDEPILPPKKREATIEPPKPEKNLAPLSQRISDSVFVENKTALNDVVTTNVNNSVTSTSNLSASTDIMDVIGDNKGALGTIEPKQDFEVDSMPEFEGGLPALAKFIANNIRYPRPASEEGKGGTVHVKFVVDETGRVGNLSTLNKLGFGLEEEALRVAGIIPKFKKPAKAKGRAVKMYYRLPIKFVAR